MKIEKLSRRAFFSLPEYSMSMPTLTTIGKVWRRDLNVFSDGEPDWIICEYVDIGVPDRVGIDYRKPEFPPEALCPSKQSPSSKSCGTGKRARAKPATKRLRRAGSI